jgi:fatty-acyl-CoA synthase
MDLPRLATLEDLRRIESRPLDEVVPWRGPLDVLRASAARWPTRDALVFARRGDPDDATLPPRRVSYAALLEQVHRAANAFRAAGLAEDESVALLLPPIPQAHAALWGAEVAGRACPINTMLSVEHAAHLLHEARATVLVALGPAPGHDTWTRAQALRERVPGLKAVFRVDTRDWAPDAPGPDTGDGAIDFDAALAAQRGDALAFERAIGRDTEAATFHTGGTTGAPKLARHTHGNQVQAAWGAATLLAMGRGDVMISGFPLFHVAGSFTYGLSSLLAGATLVLPPAAGLRDPVFMANWWRWVERERVTLLAGVPTIVATLMTVDPRDADLSRVRAMLTGGSPLPTELAQAFETRYGLPVRNILGMTECAGVVSIVPFHGERRPGSCGLPVPFTEVVALPLGPDGPRLDARCAPGETGVIALRGPNVSPGYTDATRNAGTFDGGWLVSGDLGHVDTCGEVFVTGRAKDVIIRSAHNIDPAAIEEVLLRHPAVQLAAAVGQPDAYAGEVPVAFVQLRPGACTDGEALRAFVEPLISERPAVPRRIDVIDTMPLTAIGKVYKPALRAIAAGRAVDEALAPLRARGWTTRVEAADRAGGPQVAVGVDGAGAGGAQAADEAEIDQALRACLRDFTVAWSRAAAEPSGQG